MSGKVKRTLALTLAACVILTIGFILATADNEAEEEPFVQDKRINFCNSSR